MSVTEALASEIQKLAPSAIIELFELDLSSLGGEVYRFHSGTNELTQSVVWNGNTYQRYPVVANGFEYSGNGQFPRPKIAVANALSAISALILVYGDLHGAKVTRRRTMARFLDAVNFTSGVNPEADPEAEFEPDIYFIDRKSAEDRERVEFELASSCDLVGVRLPRRQIIQNICTWRYRGAECGYTGAPMFTSLDQIIQANPLNSAQANAVIAAKIALEAAKTDLASAQAALDLATQTMGNSCMMVRSANQISITITERNGGIPDLSNIQHCVIESIYDGTGPKAYLGGSLVALGSTYRAGAEYYRTDPNIGGAGRSVYVIRYIETWIVDPACVAATAAQAAAVVTRDAAQGVLDAAEDTLEAAFDDLPEDDPLYSQDVCGKRLSSCKLRFGEEEPLSFGSFPGAGLTK